MKIAHAFGFPLVRPTPYARRDIYGPPFHAQLSLTTSILTTPSPSE